MRGEYQMEVQCKPERLWSFLEEPEKQKLWMKGLLENRPLQSGPKGVGSRFLMKIKEGGKAQEYEGVVTAHDPYKHLGVVFWGGKSREESSFSCDSSYKLTPLPQGHTRLDYVCVVECRGFMKVMSFLFAPLMKMQLKSFMKTLKSVAEKPETAVEAR